MSFLAAFASELPSIRLIRRDDKDFPFRSKIWNTAVTVQPAAIALPQTAHDVAAIVKFASRTGAPFTVRAGGHELFGRSRVQDGIVIDVRALDSIHVNKPQGTAVVGGGVCAGALSKALTQQGCTTPCPNIASYAPLAYLLRLNQQQQAQLD